jgi:branched-chain amino acid transport system ATP-binding protein
VNDGLVVEDLSHSFGGLRAVDSVDLRARPGRVTALIGPNGAGKTTLLNCLAGDIRPHRGRVLLDGRDVTRLGSDARARLGMRRTFQHPAVFLSLTVAENLMTGAENVRRGGLLAGLAGLPDPGRRRAREAVEAALAELGLRDLADVRSGTLSTGVLRLVELARALAGRPGTLLLDEPASGLSDAETARLRTGLREWARGGMAVLLVEHDLDLVFGVADDMYVMVEGGILASGRPEQIRTDPAVRAAYLDVREA